MAGARCSSDLPTVRTVNLRHPWLIAGSPGCANCEGRLRFQASNTWTFSAKQTPMDYDDADFQSQNFQLAGEENSKFPSGLRPFALPKLDIDDQLQGNLRFDNLVDSEGFFSVEGHDTSWIEVLSTGSGVVDFSSSAAESCSIPRINYVWSEATSTECVEMLLKSVGENEMTGNMDGNAHQQLKGMGSQIDPSNTQPKSNNSLTDNIVVPAENDHSQSVCSRMAEDPLRTQPQLDRVSPFSVDGKAEQAAGSTLSDRKLNYMLESVAEKNIMSDKSSSASKNKPESCPAVGSYFQVHDDDSLDNLNIQSAGVNARKLNNEPFSELAPIQNIYASDSYRFQQDNEKSGAGDPPRDSEICHMNENKFEGLDELQNLRCPSQHLGTTNLSNEGNNETLLSDGLLEAITNPVKILHRNGDTCKGASATLQPCFSHTEHAVEGLKGSVDRSSELVLEKFSIGEEPNSAKSRESESDLRNSNPHTVTSFSAESGESIQSPNEKQFAHVIEGPVDTIIDGVDDTNIDDKKVAVVDQHQESVDNLKSVVMDANINTGDDSKLGVLEQHQDSVDNLKSVDMKEGTSMEEISAASGNIEHMVDTGHDKNARSTTGTSKDKFDSLGNVEPDNSAAGSLDGNDPNVSSVHHEESFKEIDAPVLEDDHGNQHLASPNSVTQEKKSASTNISSSNIVSTTDADTSNSTMDKLDCSGGVASDDSPAGILDGNDLRISPINHEESFKEGAHFASEAGGHNVTSPVSELWGKKSETVVNSNINAVCSSGIDLVSENTQCTEQASSLGSLTMNQTQDKSGDHQDAHTRECDTDGPSIQSEHHKKIHPNECQIDEPSVQSVHQENVATRPPSFGVSPDKGAENSLGTPLSANDDLNTCIQDHTPGTVSSQSRVSLEPGNGDSTSNDAACGSPTVIRCTEPCPQEVGQGGSTLLHDTPEQSEDPKDSLPSVDTSQSPNECSARNNRPTLSSEEVNTAGDDRSFSFKVGDSPKVYEKARIPAWNPFPISTAAQSIGASTEIPKPGSPSGNPLKNVSDDSKKMSVLESGREQLAGTKVVESVGELSISSHIGDNTKAKSAPLEQTQQHPTPESSALVHQPFTDLQHVQLRAQIFVYGALIQGIPPAEAYMVSAFGESGSDKPGWEAVWRAAVERFQDQKSPLTGLETPTSSHIGSRVAEKASKGTVAKTTPASKKGGQTVLPTHPTVPLHSPTFSMSPFGSSTLNLQRGAHLDFSQAVSPVFTYNSQMRQPTSTVASWFPQSPGPRAAPWLVPPQNLIFDSSMQQQTVAASETAKGECSKDTSISQAISPGAFLSSQTSPVSSPLVLVHEDNQKVSASTSKRGTTSQKPRKRKKASASQEQQPAIASPQLKTDIASATPSSFTLSTRSPSTVLGSGIVPNTSLITSVPNYLGGAGAERRIIFSEQICGALEQSIEQAKGASMHSAEALGHNEGVWGHLSANSVSKLPAEVEQKLTSAAAAASAAVSVAKAAAEAAKMAAAAALQAKMMADEALGSSKPVNSLQKYDAGAVDVNNDLGGVSSLTPKSSWKIRDSTHAPGSTISMAREVARKRVEEASAAARRAQNLDAILKAAELAAEAVFNAGSIIGMGEPLPFTLSELLEAGPDGYWKSDRVKSKMAGNTSANVVTEEVQVSTDFNKSGRKHGSKAKYDQATQKLELSSSAKEMQPDRMHSGNGIEDTPTTAPLNGNKIDTVPSIIWNGIGKGSLVEVLADKDGSGPAWFSAKVHDINEDNACISYELNSEGIGLHKEWVPLKQEGDKAPQIRLPHPAAMSKLNGTRKRRRDTTGNRSWAIGDHVDAWIKDSCREGIISQNCELGKFGVQFSGGASLVVDAWNLRPSLVWKDGQWTEWSRAQERKDKSNKGDSPYEKRQKTVVSDHVPIVGEAGEPSKDKSTNIVTKPEELKPLPLSDSDVIFNMGKSAVENKTTRRPGLQKEGSKVYGVPKPGKKKKFMEVSKHYVVGQADKISEGTASTRFAKHVMPQVPRPRQSTSKLDQRGKRVGDMRLKSMKSQNVSTNSVPGKDPLSMSVPSSSVFESSLAFAGSTAGSSNIVNTTVEKNISAHGTDLRTEGASVSELHIQTVPTAKKNLTTTDRAKRKYVPSVDNNLNRRLKTSEIKGQTSSDSAEPRRSNRRIQPTSRLLEGLQSSLIVSKVPGEKGPKTNYRSATSTSKGRTQG